MANYNLKYTGQEIDNLLTTTESLPTDVASESYVNAAIAALGNNSTGNFGFEVGTVERSSDAAVTKTLNHAASLVIASTNRSIWTNEIDPLNEMCYTVMLVPGATETTCVTSSKEHTISLSADGKTLTLPVKNWGVTYIAFYQL